jgi:hypothetical protein
MNKTVIMISLCLILLGCLYCVNQTKKRINKESIPITISLNPDTALTDTLRLSYIATKIEYIPLEYYKTSIIDYFYDFIVTDQYVFIKNGLEILKYTINGEFIQSIFPVGRGPGEAAARSFTLDEKNEQICVLDAYSGDVKLYDYAGNFIKRINSSINLPQHRTISIGFFKYNLFVSTAQRPMTKYIYSFFDVENDSIKVIYKNYNSYSKTQEEEGRYFTLMFDCFQITDSVILFKEHYCDTIFSVNKDLVIKAKYIIDLGKQKLKWQDFRDGAMFNLASAFPYGYWVQSFIETRNLFILVLRSYYNPEIFAVLNKRTGTVNAFKNRYYERPSSQIILKNDIDQLIMFPPMNREGDLYYYNGCLYSVVEAKEFSDAYCKASEKTKNATRYLREMAPIFDEIDEFSNPVIVKVYLK